MDWLRHPAYWAYSSFHCYVRDGTYSGDWGANSNETHLNPSYGDSRIASGMAKALSSMATLARSSQPLMRENRTNPSKPDYV